MIGGTCKRGNAFSGPVLIARGLDFEHVRCCYGVLKVCRARKSSRGFHNFGGLTGRETPLPIPNREVKPARADGTRRATSRESRSPPINFERAGFAGSFSFRRNASISGDEKHQARFACGLTFGSTRVASYTDSGGAAKPRLLRTALRRSQLVAPIRVESA